jgi:hypothetical protein
MHTFCSTKVRAIACVESLEPNAASYIPPPIHSADGTPAQKVSSDMNDKLFSSIHKYKAAFESTKAKESTIRHQLDLARNAQVR